MWRIRRTAATAAVLSGLVVVGGGLVAGAPAASAAGQVPVPKIAWTSCGDEFECAKVPVPVDYDVPSHASITISLIRLPADPAERKGSLFIDPGGPGDSGVTYLETQTQLRRFPQELRDAYDLIGFDPRGVGDSTPLTCFDNQEDASAAQHAHKFPITEQDVADWQRVDRLFADACAAKGGPILQHLSTANVARDLDLLRRSVGDARLNFLGYSYGSYIGMTYANMFPNTVGAFVIDGVLDPIAWATGNGATSRFQPFTVRIRSAQGSEDTLDQFLRLCDQAGDKCAFSGNARGRFEALLERAKASPIPYPGVPQLLVTDDQLIGLMVNGLSGTDWSDLANLLLQLEAQPQAPAAASTAVVAGPSATSTAPAVETYGQFEPYSAVPCSETDNPSAFSAWPPAADKASVRFPHFGRYWTWVSSVCSAWPARDADRYSGPWRATTSNPVLVVGSYYDAATPYEGAQTASRLLKNARLLSYAGWGHKAYLTVGNACIDDAVNRYLVSNVLPARNTVCQPKGSPFD